MFVVFTGYLLFGTVIFSLVLEKSQTRGPGQGPYLSTNISAFAHWQRCASYSPIGRARAGHGRLQACLAQRDELLSQLPQPLVEFEVLRGVGDGTSAAVADVEATLDQVLLHPVEDVPQSVALVGVAPCFEDGEHLVILGLALFADAEDEGVGCELPHVDGLHLEAVPAVDLTDGLLHELGLLVEQGLYGVVGQLGVALAEAAEVLALDDKAVGADEAEDAELGLEGTGTVVAVDEDHGRPCLDGGTLTLDVDLGILEFQDVDAVLPAEVLLGAGLLGVGYDPSLVGHLVDDVRGGYEVVPLEVDVVRGFGSEGCRCELGDHIVGHGLDRLHGCCHNFYCFLLLVKYNTFLGSGEIYFLSASLSSASMSEAVR